jgi:uncharacterized NAD(P)/FAD-binding protein YdhS
MTAADAIFVGGGVSSSYTFLSLLDEMRGRPSIGRPIRTILIEQTIAEYGGVPYGSRSGPVSLIITSLHDFLPEPERSMFVDWIVAHRESLVGELAATGAQGMRWLLDNREAIANDDWLSLYVPRRFFGRYIDERVREAVAAAEADGLIEHQLVHGEATGIEPAAVGYAVQLASGDSFTTKTLVIGIGSMPLQRRFPNESDDDSLCLVDDVYLPGLPANVDRIRSVVASVDKPRVLVLGSNASALEALYVLNDRDDEALRRVQFTVMSPGGVFPEKIVAPREVAVPTPALDQLAATDKAFSAEELYEAARLDIAAIREAGITVTESLSITGRTIGGLVGRLVHEEKLAFAAKWGVALGRFQRRAGGEYSDNVEQLRALGRLAVRGAAFDGLAERGSAGARVRFRDGDGDHVSDEWYSAIVNCAGFSSMVAAPESRLVSQLLSTGLCAPVPTGCGFVVNDRMEAAPGVFVMGPLLAGNVVNGQAIWHVEHCGRIAQFSSTLGRTLADQLLAG